MYASRLLESFEPLELRTGPLGAKYNLGLLPKDRHKVPKFINYWAPQGAQVSDQAYGYLIVTEGENFTRFHSDIDESLASLATLYGSGEKIWFFVRPSKFAQRLEDEFVTPDSLMRCLVEHGSSLACCTQEIGDTVYLPYGWVHCVVTPGNVSCCSSLLSIGLRVPSERYEQMWQSVTRLLPVGERRQRFYERGAKCKDLER